MLRPQTIKTVITLSLICTIPFFFACVNNSKKDNSKKDTSKEVPVDVNLTDTTIADTFRAESQSTPILKQPTFKLVSSAVFEPQNKKIVLMQGATDQKLLLFQTTLQVNTDGTPLSYHPQDLGGKTKAINTIGNAVAIYKDELKGNIFLKKGFYSEAMSVFEQFKDADYNTVPTGYKINWKNVLIAERKDGIDKPCIFKSGKYKGYYASATALKNGLKSNKGDCNCNNQVNPLEIPALVLVGGKNNPLWKNGARLGDLLVAYNPINNAISYAIINDIGPRNKLGEGSVLLNMQLNEKKAFPRNRKETYNLITKNNIIIALIPGSRNYQVEKPYTAENIKYRITLWLNENGYNNEEEFVEFLKRNVDALK